MPDILAWARRFVATPSVSRDGNAEMARLAAELLREVGGEPRLVPAEHDGVEHFCVIADFGPPPGPDRDGLLLVTHLDTVPPGDPALWTETGGDPWSPVEKNGLLYGLGSADAKVDLVCKVAALARIDTPQLTRPLRVVGTFAEEIGLVGARWLVAEGYTRGYGAALVGEPSDLTVIHAHKGYAVFEARVALSRLPTMRGCVAREDLAGQSAHSSTPALGRNAVEDALERLTRPDVRGLIDLCGGGAVNQVPAACTLEVLCDGDGDSEQTAEPFDPEPLIAFHMGWRRLLSRLAEHKDAAFDPDCTVGNLGRVSMQDGVAVFGFDLRPVPGIDPHEAVSVLEDVADVQSVRANPPLGTPRNGELVRAIVEAQQACGLGERVGTKPTCTEAGLLAEAGLDAVVLGAGTSIGNVHRPNEHTRVAELETSAALYAAVIQKLCAEDA